MIEIAFIQALMLAFAGLVLGIIMLVKGGDWTVEGAVYLSEKIGLSHLVIGFTVIAFGTSLPELIVSVNANLDGSPGIAVGNVLGSNIANILLVCGAALLVAPIAVTSGGLGRTTLMMLGITVLMTGLLLAGGIGRWAGGLMLVVLLAYVIYEYNMAKKGEFPLEEFEEPHFKSSLSATAFLIFGLLIVSLGAEFMVSSAQLLASMVGIPESVIALTIIAFGTSLPELSTCLIAMRKRHGDIVLGNLIGSNVFNILMILGATALVIPLDTAMMSAQVVVFDVWVTLAIAALFTALILFRKVLGKRIGIAFVGSYILYVIGIYGFYIMGWTT